MADLRPSSPATARLEPYPEYMDSGVEWLGEIPAHWKSRPLKYLVEFKGGGTPSKHDSRYWSGDIPWVSPKDMRSQVIGDTIDHITPMAIEASATRLVDEGAVLVVVRSGILRHRIPAAIAGQRVALNQDMRALVSLGGISPRYLRYFIEGMEEVLLVEWRQEGATVESLGTEPMASSQIPMPPDQEQQVISDFLDRETARIDALVAKQERLIDLLREKRTALIGHVVTKGLDPDVHMKDSGVEWLGGIPAHWETQTLRRCVNVTGGVTPSTDVQEYWGGSIPWVTPKDMKREAIGDSTIRVTDAAVNETSLTMIEAGAVLIVARGMILAKAVPVAWTTCPVTINQDMKALTPVTGIDEQFLARTLQAAQDGLRSRVDVAGHGSRRLPTHRWRAMPLAIPPLDEQERIVRYIEKATTTMDAIAERARSLIAFLEEQRTALISSAVTGKIDVRRRAVPEGEGACAGEGDA